MTGELSTGIPSPHIGNGGILGNDFERLAKNKKRRHGDENDPKTKLNIYSDASPYEFKQAIQIDYSTYWATSATDRRGDFD